MTFATRFLSRRLALGLVAAAGLVCAVAPCMRKRRWTTS